MVINRTVNLVDDATSKGEAYKVMVMTVGADIAKFVKAFPDRFFGQSE